MLVTEEISQVNFRIWGISFASIFGIGRPSGGHRDFLPGFYLVFTYKFRGLFELQLYAAAELCACTAQAAARTLRCRSCGMWTLAGARSGPPEA